MCDLDYYNSNLLLIYFLLSLIHLLLLIHLLIFNFNVLDIGLMNNNNSKPTEFMHYDKIFFQNQNATIKSKYIANKKAYVILKMFNKNNKNPILFESIEPIKSIYSMKGGGCNDESIDDDVGSCGGNKSYD